MKPITHRLTLHFYLKTNKYMREREHVVTHLVQHRNGVGTGVRVIGGPRQDLRILLSQNIHSGYGLEKGPANGGCPGKFIGF